MNPKTKRMENLIEQIDSFLDGYKEGTELQLYISSGEKSCLEEYVQQHQKGGKDFYFQLGISKPGLERDYRLRKKI